jgi:putative membrane protein
MNQSPRTPRQYVTLFLKGMAMGGADVVPGVSGGTIAFITGIYETLLDSIASVDADALQLLRQGRWRDLWQHINGNFLVTLFGGIFLSILTLAQLLGFLLEAYPIQLWSFFFGLIIIAAYLVAKEIKQWSAGVVVAAAVGIAIAYYITLATPAETPTDLWFVFLSGSVAICAMILPGISGSFILLILGKYAFILEAVNERNLTVIAVFGLGCVVGILAFARVISWLLDRYHDVAVALLAGFMIGSLGKIWPWKEAVLTHLDRHGEEVPLVTRNVLPAQFEQLTGQDALLGQAILFMLVGFLLVLGIERFANYQQKKGERSASV